MSIRSFILAATALVAAPASALETGETPIRIDGGRGVINVTEGGDFRISIGGPGCTGGGKGRLLRGADGGWAGVLRQDGRTCVVLGDGGTFYGAGDCSHFHGASCGFAGRITRPEPEIEGPEPGRLIFVEISVETGFEEMDERDRSRVQRELAFRGLYDARVDGAYGPSTRAALRAFGEERAAASEYVGMARPSGVREILLDLINQDAEEIAEAGRAATFVGDWGCTGQRKLTFTADAYEVIDSYYGSTLSAGALTAKEGVAPTADTQTLTLEGFRILTLGEITPNTMLAHDPGDGGPMRCRRIGG